MVAKRLRDPQAASHKHLQMGIPTALLIDEQVEKKFMFFLDPGINSGGLDAGCFIMLYILRGSGYLVAGYM